MDDSILTYIKKRIGIAEEYTDFDTDIIGVINMAFAVLTQLGCGPKTGFRIEDDQACWADYLDEERDVVVLGMTKEYIYTKAKLAFDPPQSSVLVEVLERSADEFEERIKIECETPSTIFEGVIE